MFRYMNWNKFLKKISQLTFFSIIVIGLALRIYKWCGHGFWYDETQWMLFVSGTLQDLLKHIIYIAKPPLFGFFLYFWQGVGQDEFILRLLPVIFGLLSIVVTYKLGKILFDRRTALIASFIVSINPFHVYYSQELTHYSAAVFLILCSIYYFIRALNEDKMHLWCKYILFTALSLYVHYSFLFLLISENLYLIFSRHAHLRKKWFISQGILSVVFLPWVGMIFKQIEILDTYYSGNIWIPRGSLQHIMQTFKIFTSGYNAEPVVNLIAFVFFLLLFVYGITIVYKNDREKFKLILILLFAPMFLSMAFSEIARTFTYRNFIFISPLYYLISALALVSIRRYTIPFLVLLSYLFGLSLLNYYENTFHYPEDFYRPGVHAKIDNKRASEYIINHLEQGDRVIHTCRSTAIPYLYYLFSYSNKSKESFRRILISKDIPFSIDKKTFSGEGFVIMRTEQIPEFVRAYRRIWLVLSRWEPRELFMDESLEENLIKKQMDSQFKKIGYSRFDGVDVFVYGIK